MSGREEIRLQMQLTGALWVTKSQGVEAVVCWELAAARRQLLSFEANDDASCAACISWQPPCTYTQAQYIGGGKPHVRYDSDWLEAKKRLSLLRSTCTRLGNDRWSAAVLLEVPQGAATSASSS